MIDEIVDLQRSAQDFLRCVENGATDESSAQSPDVPDGPSESDTSPWPLLDSTPWPPLQLAPGAEGCDPETHPPG